MYGRPGLVRRRPLLRAAAVGGTFAAGRAMGRRAAEQASAESYQDHRIADPEDQQHQAPGDTGSASAAGQLSKLAELHLQGELTDDEFAAAKAITLGPS
jgi:hypothetical protein